MGIEPNEVYIINILKIYKIYYILYKMYKIMITIFKNPFNNRNTGIKIKDEHEIVL